MTNVGTNPISCSADNPCKYTINSKEETVKEFCSCGKNPTGQMICHLGNGADEYAEYLNNLKTLLTNINGCNAVERGPCLAQMKEQGKKHSGVYGEHG